MSYVIRDTKTLFTDFDKDETQAIVIPVNCVGVMGKGVALEFKKREPGVFASYKQDCNLCKIKPGQFYLKITLLDRRIVLAATKDHWRNPSKLEWIENILFTFCEKAKTVKTNIKSIGVPALGCGEGALNWDDVQALYAKYLTDSPIHFICYAP